MGLKRFATVAMETLLSAPEVDVPFSLCSPSCLLLIIPLRVVGRRRGARTLQLKCVRGQNISCLRCWTMVMRTNRPSSRNRQEAGDVLATAPAGSAGVRGRQLHGRAAGANLSKEAYKENILLPRPPPPLQHHHPTTPAQKRLYN